MFSISNEELAEKQLLGKVVHCKKCGSDHPIKYGKKKLPDGSMIDDKMIAFYECHGNLFLVGINGRAV